MSVVINRNYEQEAEYKTIQDEINTMHSNKKCANYGMLSKEQVKGLSSEQPKVTLYDPDWKGNDGKDKKKKKAKKSEREKWKEELKSSGPSKYRMSATGQTCSTQLHTIINRRFIDNMGDYWHSGCSDPTVPKAKKGEKTKPQSSVSFAQKGAAHVLTAAETRELKHDQQPLSPLF